MFEKLVEDFLFHCIYEKNLSQKTIKAYKIDIKQYKEFIDITDKNFDDKELLKSYVKYLFSKNYKEKTIKRKLATLKAFFSHLEFEEIIDINPFRKVRLSIKEPKMLPKTLNLKEIKKIFTYVYKQKENFIYKERYTYKSIIRDIAVLELLFATGIRVSEVCNLRVKDMDLQSGVVLVFGKGSKQRTLHICDSDVKKALREYIENFNKKDKNEILFTNRLGQSLSEQSVRFMIKKYQEQSGVLKHTTPHMFRHSFATLLLEEGVDIRYIQQMLGHSSISTTQIYTQVNLKHQKKILGSKHPRRRFVVDN